MCSISLLLQLQQENLHCHHITCFKMSSPQQQEQQQPDFPLSTHSPGALEVRKVRFEVDTEGESGRGVFTTIDIPRGTLVEAAHAVKIEKKEYDDHLNKTCLEHYVYSAPSWNGDMWLALGIGSLFNHADPPNLDYRISEKDPGICIW